MLCSCWCPRTFADAMKVFDESVVQRNPNFFFAGRGGETNLHKGNHHVRQQVLANAKIYAALGPRERGQKFALKLLQQDLSGITFVVRLSYFWKNYKNGKIAAAKLESVIAKHGSLSRLEEVPPTAYVTIGETWCLNIIGAILRQAAGKLDLPAPASKEATSKTKNPRRRSTKRKAPASRISNKDRSVKALEVLPDTSLLALTRKVVRPRSDASGTVLTFHVPGHQQGRGAPSEFEASLREDGWRADITQVLGMKPKVRRTHNLAPLFRIRHRVGESHMLPKRAHFFLSEPNL